jgi:hypothetical protein
MAVHTFSKFFYDFVVDADSLYISFSEGGGEIIGEVVQSSYAPSQGLYAVASAMNNVGSQVYSITMDRLTRLVTISSTGTFTLKVNTTSVANNIFEKLGFTGADRTGANTYTGNLPIAKVYAPQFKLQDYMPSTTNLKSIDPTVRKTADGKVEVVRFGTERFVEFSIKFATNKKMDGLVIKNNPNGLEDLIAFMDFVITKAPIEFMPAELDPNTFEILRIEKTSDDKNGMSYSLDEQYKKNLPDVYESGKLTFRLVEL